MVSRLLRLILKNLGASGTSNKYRKIKERKKGKRVRKTTKENKAVFATALSVRMWCVSATC